MTKPTGNRYISVGGWSKEPRIYAVANLGLRPHPFLQALLQVPSLWEETRLLAIIPDAIGTYHNVKENLNIIQMLKASKEKPQLTEITESDIGQLELDLYGQRPVFPNLAVFIQSPADPDMYHFRKIGVEQEQMNYGKKKLSTIVMRKYDMREFELIPCPSGHLQRVVREFSLQEEMMELTLPKLRAVVGTAVYKGKEKPSVDYILSLAALKYNSMRSRI